MVTPSFIAMGDSLIRRPNNDLERLGSQVYNSPAKKATIPPELVAQASNEMLARWVLKNLDWTGGNDDRNGAFLAAILGETWEQAQRAARPSVARLTAADQVEWVVNDNAELGVKIGDQFFWLYKGHSLVYGDPEYPKEDEADGICKHDNGTPMHWRPVFKREFGECCHPVNYKDPTKWGTVSLTDSDEWKPLPTAKAVRPSTAPRAHGLTEKGVEYMRKMLVSMLVKASGSDTDPDAAKADELCNMALAALRASPPTTATSAETPDAAEEVEEWREALADLRNAEETVYQCTGSAFLSGEQAKPEDRSTIRKMLIDVALRVSSAHDVLAKSPPCDTPSATGASTK